MKFSCLKKDLVRALTDISKAAINYTIPILEGVCIETGEDSVTLTCYNLDFGITATIPAAVAQKGKTVVTAGGLRKLAKKMTGAILTVTGRTEERPSIEEGKEPIISYFVELSDDYARLTLNGMKADDYPQIPELGQTKEYNVPQRTLRSMLEQTLYAVAKVDTKPIHTGVLFDLAGGRLNLVSVDGYRLALRQENLDSCEETSFVVPGSCLSIMVKLLSERDNVNAKLLNDGKYVTFEFGAYKVFSRLLDGEFMNYKNVIPNPSDKYVVVAVKQLSGAVGRAIEVSGKKSRIPLRIEFVSDGLNLAVNSQNSEYSECVRCTSFGIVTGMAMGVNANYLLDVLKVLACDKLRVEFGTEYSPMRLVSADGGGNFVHILLPSRLNNRQVA